jgi:LysR family transcriptional regulator, nod-box dependent transcriptional activator
MLFIDCIDSGSVFLNLRNVDLNLLVALDALLAERNVGRAGQRIGLGQSAMSAALARLRIVFRDPLLVRSGRNLVLTRAAEELITPIREILSRIEQTISERPQFNPRTDSRSFSVSASDYATLVLLVPAVRRLLVEAPNVTIHILPRVRDIAHILRIGQADMVIEPQELFADTKFPSQFLFNDRWLCAVDAKNPRVRNNRLTMKQYLRLPHLVYNIGTDRQLNLADRYIGRLGVRRRIDVTVESFLLVPFFLEGTPMISLMLERASRQLAGMTKVRTLKPPMKLPDINEALYWHPRHTTDPGHRWLRECLRAIASELHSPNRGHGTPEREGKF